MCCDNEIWEDVPEYEGLYKISNTGKIKNKYGKQLKTYNKHGKKKYNPENDYQKIRLSKNGTAKAFAVHRLVAKAFIPNPKKLPQINHKNGIKKDNNVANLEWCTNKENCLHYRKYLKGDKNGNSK